MISAKRWWFVALLLVSVTALMVTVGGLSAVAAPSSTGAAPPGETKAELGADGQFAFFTTYPDMSTCELVYANDCYGLTNGTVVGEQQPDTFLNEFVALLPPLFANFFDDLPFVGQVAEPDCFDIPTMGSPSAEVDEVYDGSDMNLEVGPGGCSDIATDLEAGTVDIVPGNTDETIVPIDAESTYQRPYGGFCRGRDIDYYGTCIVQPNPPPPAPPRKPLKPLPPGEPETYPRTGHFCRNQYVDIYGTCIHRLRF